MTTHDFIHGLGNGMLHELGFFILGPRIGIGTSRDVFEFNLDKSMVVKVENKAGSFSNVTEWQVWREIKGTKAAKWLAPCAFISQCGSFLIQQKAEDIHDDRRIPKKIPRFLTDVKKENFGIIDGRVVCRDYGNVLYNFQAGEKKFVDHLLARR